MPEKFIQKLINKKKSEPFKLWFENERPLSLFIKCRTQWNTTYIQGLKNIKKVYEGLNYQSVQMLFQTHQIPPQEQAELLAEIQLIERGALEVLNE